MIAGCTAPSPGTTSHWSGLPGIRDLHWQREVEAHFRAGFARSAGIIVVNSDMAPDRLDWLLAVVESARSLLRRRGPTRAGLPPLPFDWSRWCIASYLRGLSHGLQYAKPLLGCGYELQVWRDAVDEWAAGDPDTIERPPVPVWQPESSEVSA